MCGCWRGFAALIIFLLPSLAWPSDEVSEQYRRLIVHHVDSRSAAEKGLNLINLTGKDVGRGFAVIAGISKYPLLNGPHGTLEPAEQDMLKLVAYLRDVERFEDIVLLKDDDMTYENLRYFLQAYIPDQLKANPKSRFLFAYSGHGFNDGPEGYLLESRATSMKDRSHAINLRQLRDFFPQIVRNGHQVLVLINACYGGAFLQRSYGQSDMQLPTLPGAHAITAGGSDEVTWQDPRVGTGSVFFEKLFAGLSGIADTYPLNSDGTRGDGVITVSELVAYLQTEVRVSTDSSQNPQWGELGINGPEGGSFFFLSRRRQEGRPEVRKWDLTQSFGERVAASPMPPPDMSHSRSESLSKPPVSRVTVSPSHQNATVAVMPFGGYSLADYHMDMAEIIQHDLEGTGRLNVLQRNQFPDTPTDGSSIVHSDWKSAGVDYVVMGHTEPVRNGQFKTTYSVINTAVESRAEESQWVGLPNSLRTTAHIISDGVYRRILGIHGVFTSRVAYVAIGSGPGGQYQLVVADADGEEATAVLGGSSIIASPTWSPDGKELAYIVFDDNGSLKIVVQTIATAEVSTVFYSSKLKGPLAWSPDGSKLAITLTNESNRTDIYTLELANNLLTRVTDGKGSNIEPEWSPDGNSLYFASDRLGGGGSQIFRIGLQTHDAPVQITHVGTYNSRPRVSADNTYLAMVSLDAGSYRIAVQVLATGQIRVLSHGPRDLAPSFGPDNTSIMYWKQKGSREVLGRVSVSGQQGIELESARSNFRDPAWNPVECCIYLGSSP